MTSVQRLLARLGTMVDLPDGLEFHSTRAGIRQREAGAWSWSIQSGHVDVFASYSTVGDLLRAERLALVPASRRACVRWEVYDAKDIGSDRDAIVEFRCWSCGGPCLFMPDDSPGASERVCQRCGDEWPDT